jgi:hypothetical protein
VGGEHLAQQSAGEELETSERDQDAEDEQRVAALDVPVEQAQIAEPDERRSASRTSP